MTLLLIDDDPDDIQILTEVITAIQPESICIVAESAHDAMNFLASGLLPDYIFMDINMPSMDGMSCLEYIRKIFDLGKTSIIMYSTSINAGQRKVCEELDAKWLVKPNSYSGIFESLQYLIKS
jgi:CheY-like chemotaxis protein